MPEELEQEPRDWRAFRQARKNHKRARLERGQRERQRPQPDKPSREYRAKDCITVPRLNPAQIRELKNTGKATLSA
jgi:hypothetical protein